MYPQQRGCLFCIQQGLEGSVYVDSRLHALDLKSRGGPGEVLRSPLPSGGYLRQLEAVRQGEEIGQRVTLPDFPVELLGRHR